MTVLVAGAFHLRLKHFKEGEAEHFTVGHFGLSQLVTFGAASPGVQRVHSHSLWKQELRTLLSQGGALALPNQHLKVLREMQASGVDPLPALAQQSDWGVIRSAPKA